MNFNSSRKVVEIAYSRTCCYCNREFGTYRALHNHLRVHQDNWSLRGLNFHGRSSNSIDISRNHPIPLLNSEQNLAGANNPIPITRAPPAIDLRTMFRPNEANQADRNRSTVGIPRVPQTQIFMFNGVAILCNSSPGRAFVPAGTSASMASAIHVPSGSVVNTGLDTDSSPNLGSNVVCQFNTDEFQISQDGLPPTSRDALKSTQGFYLEKVGQSRRSFPTVDGSKRPYIADNPVNANKKPRIASDVNVVLENLQLIELPLLDNFVESTSSAETGDGAEEEEGFQLRAIRHSKPYASDGVFCLALGLTNFSWHSTPSMLCEGIISPYGISCPLFLHEGVLFVCEVMISEYEIQRNSWTMTKKMYVAGGNSADLFDLDSAEVLDPAIGNWPFLVSPRG
ncbi:hypothetical protein V6N11_063882 [Hibiscus sabdariffa]|uniref:C2H2-type domain-containing protein n=1 Tax=Hibiscus sabdariffa TaxID=183260 RepID=A0ABR2PM08_9ROSI